MKGATAFSKIYMKNQHREWTQSECSKGVMRIGKVWMEIGQAQTCGTKLGSATCSAWMNWAHETISVLYSSMAL